MNCHFAIPEPFGVSPFFSGGCGCRHGRHGAVLGESACCGAGVGCGRRGCGNQCGGCGNRCGGCARFCPTNPCGTAPGTAVTLSGTVTGTDGTPAAGLPIRYSFGGTTGYTYTDMNGVYMATVPAGASVSLAPQIALGVTATPPSYDLATVCASRTGLNFALAPVGPPLMGIQPFALRLR